MRRLTDMSLISHITRDHNEVKNFYKEYEKYRSVNNWVEARKWYNQFAWEVARHSAAEELVLYPFMQKHHIAGVEQNLTEHQEVKEKLARIESLDIENIEFQNLMQSVMSSLEEHMNNEENTELPNLAKVVSDERLDELGNEFQRYKKYVPTHPHPNAPNKPPFETVVGLLTMPIDKLRDMFKDFPSDEEVTKHSGV